MNELTWTVAYRRVSPKPEPVFHRVDLHETWHAASGEVYAAYVTALGEDYDVWYTTSRASELTDRVAREDVMNILEDDVRVPIADDGLPLDQLS